MDNTNHVQLCVRSSLVMRVCALSLCHNFVHAIRTHRFHSFSDADRISALYYSNTLLRLSFQVNFSMVHESLNRISLKQVNFRIKKSHPHFSYFDINHTINAFQTFPFLTFKVETYWCWLCARHQLIVVFLLTKAIAFNIITFIYPKS